jgi:hypothetical protein
MSLTVPITKTRQDATWEKKFKSVTAITVHSDVLTAAQDAADNLTSSFSNVTYKKNNLGQWQISSGGYSLECSVGGSQAWSNMQSSLDNKLTNQSADSGTEPGQVTSNPTEACLAGFSANVSDYIKISSSPHPSSSNPEITSKNFNGTLSFQAPVSFTINSESYSVPGVTSVTISTNVSCDYEVEKKYIDLVDMRATGTGTISCSTCSLLEPTDNCPTGKQSRYKFCQTEGCVGVGCIECY